MLKSRKRINDKKGQMGDMITWVVVAFIVLIVFGILGLIFWNVNDSLYNVGTIGDINVSNITETIVSPSNAVLLNWLNIIGFIIIIGGGISILVSNFAIRVHPIFLAVYFLLTVMAIVAAVYISNTYVDLLSNVALGSYLQQFSMGNFIMTWLPYFTAVIGVFGMIFLFIGIIKERDVGVGI